VDKSFIGADAIHHDGTISNVNIEEVPIKQAMIDAADKVILLTDSSKFGITAFAKVAEICDVDYVITDQKVPSEIFDYCQKNKVQLLIA
jgi:DeoR/GlpR family transcriptional regulator of sugar metabolism